MVVRTWCLSVVTVGVLAGSGGAAEVPFAPMVGLANHLSSARQVIVGDIEADGDLDVVVIFRETNNLIWFRNDGEGSLSTAQGLLSLNGVFEVALADLDRDGDLDLVTQEAGNNRLQWRPWDRSTEEFGAPRLIDSAEAADAGLLVVDADRDGDLDIFAGDTDIVYLENAGDATFTRRILATGFNDAYDFDFGDIDGDGIPDLVASLYDSGEVAWISDPTGQGPELLPLVGGIDEPRQIHLDDVDRDGDLDVFVALATAGEIRWYENTGVSSPPPSWPSHVAASGLVGGDQFEMGDVDGDGDLDVVVPVPGAHRLAWYANAGTGESWTLEADLDSALSGPRDVALADLDRDGDLDVAAVWRDSPMVAWFENLGPHLGIPDRAWAAPEVVASGLGSAADLVAVGVADFDGDGAIEVAATRTGVNGVAIFERRVDGIWVSTTVGGAGVLQPNSLEVLDADANGVQDLLVVTSDSRVWWIRRASGFSASQVAHLPGMPNLRLLAVGDLDRDGRPDAVLQGGGATSTSLVWLRNVGGSPQPPWSLHTVAFNLPGSHRGRQGAVVDLDQDGDLDIVARGPEGAGATWYRNDRSLADPWPRQDLSGGVDGLSLAAADIDGDGWEDIVLAAEDGAATLLSNPRSWGSAWTQRPLSSGVATGNALRLVDLDRDGDLDLLAAAQGEGGMVWFEHPAVLEDNWVSHSLGEDVGPPSSTGGSDHYAAAASDLNRDGAIELVVASAAHQGVRVLRSRPGHMEVAGEDRIETMGAGQVGTVLALRLRHLGRIGDEGIDLPELDVAVESVSGASPGNVWEYLVVFDDLNQDGEAQVGVEPVIGSASPASGLISIALDLDPLEPGDQRALVVVAEAFANIPVDSEVLVTINPAGQRPLAVEHPGAQIQGAGTPDVSGLILVTASLDIFADGFESGDTSLWSATTP